MLLKAKFKNKNKKGGILEQGHSTSKQPGPEPDHLRCGPKLAYRGRTSFEKTNVKGFFFRRFVRQKSTHQDGMIFNAFRKNSFLRFTFCQVQGHRRAFQQSVVPADVDYSRSMFVKWAVGDGRCIEMSLGRLLRHGRSQRKTWPLPPYSGRLSRAEQSKLY